MSELRKSLDSIQSLLSQSSPMTATSLSSRIQRASLESGLETGGRSPANQHQHAQQQSHNHHHHHQGGRGGSLDNNGEQQQQQQQRYSGGGGGGVQFQNLPPGSSLAPIAEPRNSHTTTSSSSSGRGSHNSMCSLEIHHSNAMLSPESSASGGGRVNRDSLSYTPFDHYEQQQQQHGGAVVSNNANQFQTVDAAGMQVVGSPHSAFSAVNNFSSSAVEAQRPLSGPPFSGFNNAANVAPTPAHASVTSGALGGVSSASRTGGQTMASSHFDGMGNSAGKRTTFDMDDHTHHSRNRRETSLLVSPVSHHSSMSTGHHSHASPAQSEMSAATSVFGSQAASPPSGSVGVDATPSATTLQHGPTGTPMVSYSQHHGPTGTPMAPTARAAASAASSNSKAMTPASAGLTIHTTLQHNGRDPTPSHYRSMPSTTSPYHAKNTSSQDHTNKKTSDASSRSGRDPPAKSPFPTSITSHASNSGFLVTSKSTPNAHSHHYHKQDHNQSKGYIEGPSDEGLSMIEEDESLNASSDESLVSNITGTATFVRTPIMRKQFGNHTPRKTATSGKSTGGKSNKSHGHQSVHGAHFTPRSIAMSQLRTPGSTSSTAIHATPSTSQLLHRPSLAMRESLAHLATTTSHALEEIWDCVGVAPDERASQLAGLVERIEELCQKMVDDEERVRDQYRKEIDEARTEWEELCNSLMLENEEDPVARMKRDPSAKDLDASGDGRIAGSGMSLHNEYEAITGRLESLRSVKQAAMADLEVSRGKIYEAFAALHGCSVEEAAQATEMHPYSDIETNLTLEQRELFRIKTEEYEESVSSRAKSIVSLLLDCQSVIRELEIVPPAVTVGRCEDDSKIMNSLEPNEEGNSDGPHQRRGQSHNYTIASFLESPTCIGISNSAMDRLINRIEELNGEKKHRRAKLGEMGQAISTLWNMLRVPPEEQRAFTTSIHGLGLDTMRKGEAEIARLEDLKYVMIGKLVREQRSMIQDLWEKTNSSAAERASFDAYFHIHDDEQLTSAILHKHEQYVNSLRGKLEKMQPILDLIAKREAIIEDRIELEFLLKDPDRLKGRGATKQLMKEEKMNRRVKKELPKITAMLEKMLMQWYAENKPEAVEEGQVLDPEFGHFMYQGSPYLEMIHCQEEEWRTRKERGEQERQRKREEDRAASSSANAAFGYTTYKKLPGKKWDPAAEAAGVGARPRSASNLRSGSNMRSGSNVRGGSHPTSDNSTTAASKPRSGSTMRFGGRGPLGDVSSSRQNTSRPPSRPKGAPGGTDRGGNKTAAGTGRGYRPASAPRTRL